MKTDALFTDLDDLADASWPPDDMVPEEWWAEYEAYLAARDAEDWRAQDALDREMREWSSYPDDKWEEHSYGA